MGIFSRMNQVIRSNLNALLDRAEDPEKLITATIADMQGELKRARQELVTTLGTAKRLTSKAAEHDEDARRWEEKAVLALRAGDEELAREALRRKQRALRDAEETRRQAATAESAADTMKRMIEDVERRIGDLEARKATLAAQVRQARQNPASASTSRYGSSAFDELERMGSRIDQLEAEAEAHAAISDPDRAEVEARFRALERQVGRDAVEDELAALKKKLSG
ncbi:MAG: PspA/IM30 family protein [Myxococcota bacterium]|nr:PspA/IM30 family protein [Myxococcota bacterium]MDW8363402.1 PspA/IM30 family protein [Myxococcales bacterium]